ncbi:hypothetical protein CBOM_04263 [Ceraceosorus bombacis]|uniref:Uncharacterized protein n=1 Tax=Ceraceosorus bombacis TaxID=401625 RepID=A0A0P1BPZ2_9BASI|nr:hypothetical protein CBOM_04263 [Ceraceosorus bombacis]
MATRPARALVRSASSLDGTYDRFPKRARQASNKVPQPSPSPISDHATSSSTQIPRRGRSSKQQVASPESPARESLDKAPEGVVSTLSANPSPAADHVLSEAIALKDEGDSDVDDADYEAERMKRMKENAELLASLGLNNVEMARRIQSTENPKTGRSSHRAKANGRSQKAAMIEPTRRSSRKVSAPAYYAAEREFSDERSTLTRAERAMRRASGGAGRNGESVSIRPNFKLKSLPVNRPGPSSSSTSVLKKAEQLPDGPPPKRKGKVIHFEKGYEHFTPNLTPREMLEGGMFGGGPFRKHFSSVLHRTLGNSDAQEFEIDGIPKEKLYNPDYDLDKNRFGVKAGQTLSDWERNGWIHEQDPRGWFQWYFRFHAGRRTADDERQISRWLGAAGPNGRFKKSLVGKVMASSGRWDDEGVSPVVRQTLFHWAYQLTEEDYDKYST